MSVRMMISRADAYDASGVLLPDVEVVTDYRGHEQGVHHNGKGCPHSGCARPGAHGAFTAECVTAKWFRVPDVDGQPCGRGFMAATSPLTGEFLLDADGRPVKIVGYGSDYCVLVDALFMRTSHAGLVLDANGENNYRDDSDFYAIAWNPELGRPEEVHFGSTRGWTYPNGAFRDATPEVLAAYGEYVAEKERRQRELDEQERAAEALAEAKRPRRGVHCRVVRGRKVPIGTEGTCVGISEWFHGPRAGIRDAGGKLYWTAASNVEAVVDGIPVGVS